MGEDALIVCLEQTAVLNKWQSVKVIRAPKQESNLFRRLTFPSVEYIPSILILIERWMPSVEWGKLGERIWKPSALEAIAEGCRCTWTPVFLYSLMLGLKCWTWLLLGNDIYRQSLCRIPPIKLFQHWVYSLSHITAIQRKVCRIRSTLHHQTCAAVEQRPNLSSLRTGVMNRG